jgi:hypothetical protein
MQQSCNAVCNPNAINWMETLVGLGDRGGLNGLETPLAGFSRSELVCVGWAWSHRRKSLRPERMNLGQESTSLFHRTTHPRIEFAFEVNAVADLV